MNINRNQTQGEYGISAYFGIDRPEQTQAEREAAKLADRIKGKSLRGYFKCDDATFNSIVNDQSFPRCIGYVTGGEFRQRQDTIFLKSQINVWLDKQHARAAALPKLVK
jgi:hypothetical protein